MLGASASCFFWPLNSSFYSFLDHPCFFLHGHIVLHFLSSMCPSHFCPIFCLRISFWPLICFLSHLSLSLLFHCYKCPLFSNLFTPVLHLFYLLYNFLTFVPFYFFTFFCFISILFNFYFFQPFYDVFLQLFPLY